MTGAVRRWPVLALLAWSGGWSAASGQGAAGSMAARCAAAGAPATTCVELAVGARSLQAGTGLVAGLGSEVPGSAGTLGLRLQGSPRMAFSMRTAFAHLGLPDLNDGGTGLAREATFVVPTIQTGLAVGVFDGFFLLPTVGGVLSLDVLAQTSVLFLPTGEGFDGKASSWAVGARVGVLRESFTLPGVALSVTRRDLGRIRLGGAMGSQRGSVWIDPTVHSLRITVGKDLLSVGVLAGMGWDRYGGWAEITPGPAFTSLTVADASFHHTRRVLFAGASLNFLILQLSAEGGWAAGLGPVDGYRGAAHDPSKGTAFAGLALRLTL